MERMAVATTGLDPIVYVVQDDGGKNFLPALKYGSIETLISGRDHQLYNTAPLVKELRQKLATFKESDYLLLIGDPAAIAICAAIASENTGGKLQLLKWDRQERTYYPLLVDISKRGD
jgi:hypothetical protein